MHILHLIKTSEGAKWALDFIIDSKLLNPNLKHSIIIKPGGKYFDEYSKYCENIIELDFSIDFYLISNGRKFKKAVLKVNPDIIHSWFTQTTLYARLFLRKYKIPRLFEVVGPLHLESFLYRKFDILSAQKNDFWKATSNYTFNKYINSGVPKNKLFTNYIGIDLKDCLHNFEIRSQEKIREKYHLSADIKIIGTASYMYPPKFFNKAGVKNHELLFEVFKELIKRRDDVVLVVGGSPIDNDKRYEVKLKSIANKISTDKIIFTGYVENIGRLITEFDVFVFLSLSENLGGVYESLLFEVPTVASNRGGIPELVINGETGFACSLNSVDEIVDKIEVLLDNREIGEQFKIQGLKKVHEVFDKKKSFENSIQIYNTILSNASL
jgi:glycosyltransferase involved in cell wall biosynthesis